MKIELLSSVKYVVLRIDDVSAVTPIELLEKLYRPFFERALPLNIALIPNVNCQATLPSGELEYFLCGENRGKECYVPITGNKSLVEYLLKNFGCEVIQHGCRHDYDEFLSRDRQQIASRIEEGKSCLIEAGFDPKAFVAPYDKVSKEAFEELAKAFTLVCLHRYESQYLPYKWWPSYAVKKLLQQDHWKVGSLLLLSRPTCYLCGRYRPDEILDHLKRTIASRKLSVINSHWWEYFKEGQPSQPLFDVLYRFADYLAENPSIKVIVCGNLIDGSLPIGTIFRR